MAKKPWTTLADTRLAENAKTAWGARLLLSAPARPDDRMVRSLAQFGAAGVPSGIGDKE